MRRRRAALAVGAVAAAVSAAVAVPVGSADGSSVFDGGVVARLRGERVSLRAAPGSSRVLAVVDRQTVFGSSTTLPVVSFHGRRLEGVFAAPSHRDARV